MYIYIKKTPQLKEKVNNISIQNKDFKFTLP